MTIREFQQMIDDIYGTRDRARGSAGTFQWLAEEVGELARAIRKGSRAELEEEFADVLAWLSTLASIHGIDLADAAAGKYPGHCTKCGASPCACAEPDTVRELE